MYTGHPVLLAAVVITNLEIVYQLLPTLRFDGYYIVADLVGIPDLFKYIGPILKRAVLRRPPDERLEALKRWPQLLVTVWVLTVIPVLAVQLGIIVARLPELAGSIWRTSGAMVERAATSDSPVPDVALAGVQTLFLLLPLAGVLLILWQLLSALVRLLRKRRAAKSDRDALFAGGGAARPAVRDGS
jgi:putative peptide zinc metalloprotease protein